MIFIAFTTKGLEQIAEKEIKFLFPKSSIIESLTKRIIFSIKDIRLKELLNLRTVDDIHILLKSFENVEDLNEDFIKANLPIEQIKKDMKNVSNLRKLNNTFSLTLSRYKNMINLDSLKSKISRKLEEELGMIYTPLEHTNFDLRFHIEESNIFISCAIPSVSLYKRRYRKHEIEGALKPTIAAALCLLLNPVKGRKIVDDFCGSGTILIEAVLQGLEPYGGDIIEERVTITREAIKELAPQSINNIKIVDAKSTKWPDSYFDYAVSNIPWGKQVSLKNIVDLYSKSIKEYARILKKDGSIILLGIKPELILKHLKKNFPNHE
ncbi:MAG: methyltransferase domain-containing protein, partial [Nanoarchaeota archaeon]|nr:methyltransferase domain-containing protein [Nanoarchaeota archaeon]